MAEKYGVIPKKFTKAWWEYFWMYYKWHTISIVAVIAAIVMTIVQVKNTEKYDLTIIYKGGTYYGEDNSAAMVDGLEQYIDDIDGNGENNICFVPLVITGSSAADAQYNAAIQTKFIVSFQDDCTFLYLLDEEQANTLLKAEDMDGAFVPVSEWAPDNINEVCTGKNDIAYGISLKNSQYLNSKSFNSEDLYIFIRENHNDDDLNKKAYESSLKVARELIK